MKIEYVLKVIGVLLFVYGLFNLGVIATNEGFRESAVSLPSLMFRYSIMLPIGIGMFFLQKWSAYLLALSIISAWVILFVVYGGVSTQPIWGSLIGPVLWFFLFYKAWPKLK